jgi:sulfur-oxidizing protein SoxX
MLENLVVNGLEGNGRGESTCRCTLRTMLVAAPLALCAGLATAQESADIAAGREIAHDVYLGNCLACHQIPGDPKAVSMANIGPPISGMRIRYPDRQVLRQQIWDATQRNPRTVMPPFGKHGVLTEREIDLVVEYIYQY